MQSCLRDGMGLLGQQDYRSRQVQCVNMSKEKKMLQLGEGGVFSNLGEKERPDSKAGWNLLHVA